MGKQEVIFRPKTSWQKDDCLFCDDESTIEAVYGIAMIRCCPKEECKKQAAEQAISSGKRGS